MVIREVAGQHSFEMVFVEHDHMIETLAAERADDPFGVGILPRRSRGGDHRFDAQVLDALLDVDTEYRIAVAEKVTGCFVPGERFDDLLSCPLSCWVSGHVEVDHFSAVVAKDQKTVQEAKGERWHGEEIDGHDIADVVVEKRPPVLGRWLGMFHHVFSHRRFRYRIAEQPQLRLDTRCAPGHIFGRHPPNQIADLSVSFGSTDFASLGFPAPIPFEAPPVPMDYRFRFYQH